MSNFSQPVAQGIRFIASIITTFARFPFPGTNIPVIAFPIAAWVIYLAWRWWLSQFFDVETKK